MLAPTDSADLPIGLMRGGADRQPRVVLRLGHQREERRRDTCRAAAVGWNNTARLANLSPLTSDIAAKRFWCLVGGRNQNIALAT